MQTHNLESMSRGSYHNVNFQTRIRGSEFKIRLSYKLAIGPWANQRLMKIRAGRTFTLSYSTLPFLLSHTWRL